MHGSKPARLLLPPAARPRRAVTPRRSAGGRGEPASDALDPTGRELFEALRRHRLETARMEGVPPYVVATDRALRDIAAARPRNADELTLARGIGPAKVRRYGEGLLEVVRRHGAPAGPDPGPTRGRSEER